MQAARHEYEVNEQDGLAVQRSRNPLGTGDSNGDIFAVALRSASGVYTSLVGVTVKGEVIRADGQTVYLTGSVSSYYATVTLSPACYAVPGDLELTIKLSVGSMTRSVLRVKLDVIACTTEILATYSEGGGSIADLTGAVRYDEAQNLSDTQKAQARANIGVTSTGADISGLIDDNTTAPDKVWSSKNTAEWIADMTSGLSGQIGTLGDLDTTDKSSIIAAINEVNAKAGSGTGGSSSGTVLAYGNCIGDSLMEGAGTTDADGDGAADYDTHSVPALLAAKTGLTMRNYGVGEEMIATIVGRQGGMPMILKPIDLDGTMQYPTIPANAVGVGISAVYFGSLAGESVTPLMKTSRMAVVGDGDVNPCTIAGVEGTLTYDKTISMYTFTRTSAGGAVPLKAPTIIRTKQMKDAGEGQFLLIWMGQNNTTDTTLNDDADAFADYLIERCKNAIDYAKTDKYIILGSPLANGYANATATAYKPIYSRMQSEFGMHYINIVDYLITYAMDEYNLPKIDTSIGMTSTSDEADIAMYRIPTSLRAVKKDTSGTITGPDYVHLNGTGYSIVADQVYKRGQLLGYWT